jgi:hypothetical protein
MEQIDFLVPNKVPEVYTLEQKQEALSIAEQELDVLLRSSEDFFESREEMDATLREIRQQPDNVYTKPFMKKISAAILRVNAFQQEVEWASESVVDTSLTPAQVKAQVKQMLESQRVTLERQFDQRINTERAEWTAQLQQLRDELAEERTHRKAFQSKVKDFSEYVYLVFASKHLNLDHGICRDSVISQKFKDTILKITGCAPLYKHYNLVQGCLDVSRCNHSDPKCPRVTSILKIPLYLKYCDVNTPEMVYPRYDSMFTLPTFDESEK